MQDLPDNALLPDAPARTTSIGPLGKARCQPLESWRTSVGWVTHILALAAIVGSVFGLLAGEAFGATTGSLVGGLVVFSLRGMSSCRWNRPGNQIESRGFLPYSRKRPWHDQISTDSWSNCSRSGAQKMTSDDSFPQLLARVREGDDEAAAVIFQRFVNQLAAHAHRHLAPAVRRQTDPEDVVQSVYRTFFRRARKGQFRLDHWGRL
jgi:ECF sigma factor